MLIQVLQTAGSPPASQKLIYSVFPNKSKSACRSEIVVCAALWRSCKRICGAHQHQRSPSDNKINRKQIPQEANGTFYLDYVLIDLIWRKRNDTGKVVNQSEHPSVRAFNPPCLLYPRHNEVPCCWVYGQLNLNGHKPLLSPQVSVSLADYKKLIIKLHKWILCSHLLFHWVLAGGWVAKETKQKEDVRHRSEAITHVALLFSF